MSVDFKVFNASFLPNIGEQQEIVELANALDEAMHKYSQDLYGEANPSILCNYTVENFETDFFNTSDTFITVVLVDNIPVGFCWWYGTADYASIYNLYIDYRMRRKGYGAQLMHNVLAAVKELNPSNPSVGLDTMPNNAAAHEFYKRLGFFVDCISFRHNF